MSSEEGLPLIAFPIVAVISLGVLWMSGGCDGDMNSVSKQKTHDKFGAVLVSNLGPQEVYEVPYDEIKFFLSSSNKKRIRSICSVNMGGDGRTSSYLVVLDKDE